MSTRAYMSFGGGVQSTAIAMLAINRDERLLKATGGVVPELYIPEVASPSGKAGVYSNVTRDVTRNDRPDQTRPRPEKTREKQPPPTVDDARALAGYAAEACFINPGAVEVGKLLKVFGFGTVVSVFQHLASRDPGHWDTVRNPLALVRSLCNQVRDGDELDTQGEFETFADWRARREADVAAVGEKP